MFAARIYFREVLGNGGARDEATRLDGVARSPPGPMPFVPAGVATPQSARAMRVEGAFQPDSAAVGRLALPETLMIVVFGSINVDLAFKVPALPKPGETVVGPGYEIALGGKGANQAVAAAHDGNPVVLIGAVGTDTFGTLAREGLSTNGIDCARVSRGVGATGCAAIAVDAAGRNQIIVGAGANAALRADHVDDALLGSGATLILQREIDVAENRRLVQRAHRRGARTLLNAAPASGLHIAEPDGVDVIVVNEHEAIDLARAVGLDPAGATADALAARLERLVVVTLGAAGATAALGTQGWRSAALDVTPVDTTAAGDAFVGVFAGALDRGQSVQAALRRACIAGSLACTVRGAQPSLPRRDQIDRHL
jgi:ribokinase